MSSRNVIYDILASPRTVFNMQSLMMLSDNYDTASLSQSLYYYQKKGLIRRVRRGVYAKAGYDEKELACSFFSLSYISLQYVLLKAGVIFQFSDEVTCISTLNRSVVIDGRTYSYRRIKPEIWADMAGIVQRDGYMVATPERALLDMMYLFPGIEYFDNTDILDRDMLLKLSLSYDNKVLADKVRRLYG